jgi:hypothetical protein
MDEQHSASAAGTRRDQDIALDLMKFIAVTTGYGRAGASAAGFQGGGDNKAEDYARHLLELYGQCLGAVQKSRG